MNRDSKHKPMNQRSNRAASTWAWLTQLDFSTKQKRRQSEVKLVCWAAIVALVTLAVWGVGAWLMAPAGEQIRLELADAAGLQVGDPVSMRGIQIGQVQSIANETEMVVAMLRVESQAAESIPSDARFVVQSPGMISQALMGNSRGVEVVPQTDWNDVARNWIGGTQGENADVALLTEASSTRVAEVASLPDRKSVV